MLPYHMMQTFWLFLVIFHASNQLFWDSWQVDSWTMSRVNMSGIAGGGVTWAWQNITIHPSQLISHKPVWVAYTYTEEKQNNNFRWGMNFHLFKINHFCNVNYIQSISTQYISNQEMVLCNTCIQLLENIFNSSK